MNMFGATSVEDRRKLKVILWGTAVGIAPAVVIGPHDDGAARDSLLAGFHSRRGPVPAAFVLRLCGGQASRDGDSGVAEAQRALLPGGARLRHPDSGFVRRRDPGIGAGVLASLFGELKNRYPGGRDLRGAAISGATQVHRRVRTHLDRAFFRSAYDARQILEDLADRTLNVTSREDLAELLHNQICDALHPEALFIYLRNGDGRLHAYAGRPPAEASSLSEDQAELPSLTGRGAPVDLDPQSYYGSPLDALHAECLVPIRGSSEGQSARGLAILGPRLSEEPYSSGDKRLLASVASQAGIAMRSISLAEKMAERMEAERRGEQEMQIARQVQSRCCPSSAVAGQRWSAPANAYRRAPSAAITSTSSISALDASGWCWPTSRAREFRRRC